MTAPEWYGVGRTDQGMVRKANEDAFILLNHLSLWTVADGMGGHPGGGVASRMAIDSIAEQAEQHASLLREGGDHLPALLAQFLQSAHRAISRHGAGSRHLRGMGTTVVMLHITRGPHPVATIGHLGDSRAYLFRNRTLLQLTQDHTVVNEYLREGVLTSKQAMIHPHRHVLTRALGVGEQISPEVQSVPLHPGDQLLLCSDGLTKMLDDLTIEAILLENSSDPDQTCGMLVEHAVQEGGEDNVTVVLCTGTRSRNEESRIDL